jgi:hypothetical protein
MNLCGICKQPVADLEDLLANRFKQEGEREGILENDEVVSLTVLCLENRNRIARRTVGLALEYFHPLCVDHPTVVEPGEKDALNPKPSVARELVSRGMLSKRIEPRRYDIERTTQHDDVKAYIERDYWLMYDLQTSGARTYWNKKRNAWVESDKATAFAKQEAGDLNHGWEHVDGQIVP